MVRLEMNNVLDFKTYYDKSILTDINNVDFIVNSLKKHSNTAIFFNHKKNITKLNDNRFEIDDTIILHLTNSRFEANTVNKIINYGKNKLKNVSYYYGVFEILLNGIFQCYAIFGEKIKTDISSLGIDDMKKKYFPLWFGSEKYSTYSVYNHLKKHGENISTLKILLDVDKQLKLINVYNFNYSDSSVGISDDNKYKFFDIIDRNIESQQIKTIFIN
jgi:hypothetical protein